MTPSSLRIDRLLWFLRLVPTRGAAQELVLAGHIRVSGQRIAKPAYAVRIGDVLTLPLVPGVRVIVLTRLPLRRGAASEAAACYCVLGGRDKSDSQHGEVIDGSAPADLGEAPDE